MQKIIFLLSLFIFTNAMGKEIVEYDWLTMGEVTGSQKVEYNENSVIIDFEFSDRGLGPKLHDEISLSEEGIILKQQLSGCLYGYFCK